MRDAAAEAHIPSPIPTVVIVVEDDVDRKKSIFLRYTSRFEEKQETRRCRKRPGNDDGDDRDFYTFAMNATYICRRLIRPKSNSFLSVLKIQTGNPQSRR